VVAPMIRNAAAALCTVCAWLAAPTVAQADTTLRVTASLNPAAVLYGDSVTADVEVDYDPRTVEASSIHAQPNFNPYIATAAPLVQHPHVGAVRFRYSLLCVTGGCLPAKGERLLRLRTVTATALAGTRTVTATTSWPALRITSRLAKADRNGTVRFRSPATLPAPDYRLAPGALAAGLIALAALCALGAVALAGRELARRSAHSKVQRLSPLELAIAYVRDSTARSEPDRRRALELLSEAAEGELAAEAADRAWAEPAPTPAGAAELADRAAGSG
jgi:hypothetical protein